MNTKKGWWDIRRTLYIFRGGVTAETHGLFDSYFHDFYIPICLFRSCKSGVQFPPNILRDRCLCVMSVAVIKTMNV